MADGTLIKDLTQIKRVQKVLNWTISAGLTVDGKYGEKTAAATKKLQKKASTTQNGKFGNKCLAYVKSLKK
ncbi:MAG: peptidoglycan-binding protein [Clostridiales bacterium]|nr:peptidoglycan-binding protein [Clostridiales bacterium]